MVAGNGLLRVSGFVTDCIVGDKDLFFLKVFSLLICLNFCVNLPAYLIKLYIAFMYMS